MVKSQPQSIISSTLAGSEPRYLDAVRSCCLAVNRELELGRLLDRKIGGLLAFGHAGDTIAFRLLSFPSTPSDADQSYLMPKAPGISPNPAKKPEN